MGLVLANSVLYEINTWVWLQELSRAEGYPIHLGNVPDRAWDRLKELGVAAVWLMGVWQRSPAGVELSLRNRSLQAELRRVLPDLKQRDIVGSPYCIQRYRVDPGIGGPIGLAATRAALARRGIGLVLDFVPNHLAPDHPWVREHPDWFVPGSKADLDEEPAAFLDVNDRVFARGRDPYFPPWSDVLQLNAFNRDQRQGAIAELRQIANQCDGVRCDMAMLLINQVFARTWGPRAGDIPQQEYWSEVIGELRDSHPEFRFIAEVYWDLEAQLLNEGFDACYDKRLYDQLAHGSAASIQEHLVAMEPHQERLVRFVENHDEARAAHVFPGAKALAAAAVLMTVPGVRLLHEGQLDLRTVRIPLQLGRGPIEPVPDPASAALYRSLIQLGHKSEFRTGRWALAPVSSSAGASSPCPLLAWIWSEQNERWLVVINYSAQPASGRIVIPWSERAAQRVSARELLSGNRLEVDGEELATVGLRVELEPWAVRWFHFN